MRGDLAYPIYIMPMHMTSCMFRSFIFLKFLDPRYSPVPYSYRPSLMSLQVILTFTLKNYPRITSAEKARRNTALMAKLAGVGFNTGAMSCQSHRGPGFTFGFLFYRIPPPQSDVSPMQFL